MTEEWRPIPGFEGMYEVSDIGRVKSLAKIRVLPSGGEYKWPTRIMSPARHYKGHLYVHLQIGGIKTKGYVHRLVAMAFIPNPESKPFVNHKNGDKRDNRCSNLEWATESENTNHYFKGVDKVEENNEYF